MTLTRWCLYASAAIGVCDRFAGVRRHQAAGRQRGCVRDVARLAQDGAAGVRYPYRRTPTEPTATRASVTIRRSWTRTGS